MINIKRKSCNDAEFLLLVSMLNIEFEEMYGSSKEKFNGENKLNNSTKAFVMYDGEIPVACGALKPTGIEGIFELKRMFVQSTYRGKGLSKLLLSELEACAKEFNYNTICLKTVQKQLAAIALYLNAGYYFIEPYGNYKSIPDSVCMEKKL